MRAVSGQTIFRCLASMSWMNLSRSSRDLCFAMVKHPELFAILKRRFSASHHSSFGGQPDPFLKTRRLSEASNLWPLKSSRISACSRLLSVGFSVSSTRGDHWGTHASHFCCRQAMCPPTLANLRRRAGGACAAKHRQPHRGAASRLFALGFDAAACRPEGSDHTLLRAILAIKLPQIPVQAAV